MSSRYHKLLGIILSWIIKVWLKTLRYSSVGDTIDQPGVILFLHGHQFGLLLHRPAHPLVTPISLSQDGDLQVEIMRRLGIESVRGSRNKGAVSALKGLIKHVDQGKTLLIALDGSRGPYGIPQPGGLFIADKCKKALWFCYIKQFNGIRLKTWDRFILPYPFSRVDICTQHVQSSSGSQRKRRDSKAWENQMDDLKYFIEKHNL